MEDKKLLPKLIVSILLTISTIILYFYNSTLKISLFQGQKQQNNRLLTIIFWVLFALLVLTIIYLLYYYINRKRKVIVLKKRIVDLFDFLTVIPFFFFVALILNSFICAPAVVQGQSMEPTFETHGDYVLISRNNKSYKRGDIIVVDTGNLYLVKRLIALPGDSIEIDYDGNVYINDEKIIEDYIYDEPYEREAYPKRILGDDEYFFLGDNRNVSEDSRRRGTCSFDDIVGRVFFRFLPVNRIKKF